MNRIPKATSLLLALLLIFSLAACQQTPAETTTAPTETTAAPTETTAAPTEATAPEETTEATEPLTAEELILQERRDIVEAYMRQQATILWRPTEDILYTLASDTLPEDSPGDETIQLVAGRLYMGLPYAYNTGTVDTFLEFADEPDENGIYNISGLTWDILSGNRFTARIGNDCSGAVALAWSQIGASITAQSTKYMCEDFGFLRVGDYESDPSEFYSTSFFIGSNGVDKIYAAYAQLQKGDALVYRTPKGGHAVMAVDVNVVYNEDGSIRPLDSYVTVLEQTSTRVRNQKETLIHEKTGETIYLIGGVDMNLSFLYLMQKGYLPITCKELVDPSTIAPPEVTDSETVLNKDTLLTGTISCNWFIDTVTLTITDPAGNTVQEATGNTIRRSNHTFDLQQFVTDHPNAIRGSIDPAALTSGNYHCTVVCRLTTGEEFTVRDFDFAV